MEILTLQQGSAAWHEHRKTHFNASEAACVMGCPAWFPNTLKALARVKRGIDVVEDNPYMRWGRRFEPPARDALSRRLGVVLRPLVIAEGRYSASLDAASLDLAIRGEIKCPPNVDSPLFTEPPPEHYVWQMRHQMMVSGRNGVYFFVWHPRRPKGRLVVVERNARAEARLRKGWEKFAPLLNAPASELAEPVRIHEEVAWRQAAVRWARVNAELARVKRADAAAREELIELADGESGEGAGVRLTRSERRGAVDYKHPDIATALADLDLDEYRKEASESWRASALRCQSA